MSASKGTEKRPFTLSGKVVGFTKDGRKLKGIKVKADGEKYKVKLAKPLRKALPPDLSKGQRVQMTGIAKHKKGELRLKADAIAVVDAPVTEGVKISDTALPSLDKAIAKAIAPEATAPATAKKPIKVLICQKGSCWKKRKGREICERLEKRLSDRGLREAVTIKKTGCMDRCKSGPNIVVMPGKVRLSHVGRADVDKLIDRHVALPG